MTKDEAIAKLEYQLRLIGELGSKPRFSSDFDEWHRRTQVVIEHAFGNHARQLDDFLKISYASAPWPSRAPESEFDRAFQRGLDQAASLLKSLIEEVIEYWDDKRPIASSCPPITLIENMCSRFHLVARQLCSRHENRSTLTIQDEYDVQDLLHALLILEFDDIRPEECTPSYAGGASRMDFLLKQEQIVIEVKKTRKGLGAKEIGEQLLVDTQRYHSHPDCRTLICFVYDPDGIVMNPRGLENDLNGNHDGIEVRVLFAPSGM